MALSCSGDTCQPPHQERWELSLKALRDREKKRVLLPFIYTGLYPFLPGVRDKFTPQNPLILLVFPGVG